MKAGKATLTTRVVKSAKWVFLGRFLNRGTELVKVVVLARILVPEDFGLFGLVMLTLFVFDVISHTGFSAALIQKKEISGDDLNSAWTLQVLRGILLAGLVYLSAPFVGIFFNDPRISGLIRFIALTPLIQGFINIGVIYFEKEMKFHKQFIYDVVSSFFSLGMGVYLAFTLRSVWALIWANITLVFCKFILSYLLQEYRPRIYLSRGSVRNLFQFGKWMTGYSIVIFCWQQLDKIILGKILGLVALGIYQVAQRVADLPASQISSASVNFTFPAYARLQDERGRLGQAFLDVFETIMSLVLPIVIFIFFAAPDIVYGLLGDKWHQAIIPMKLLAIVGLLNSIDIMSTPLFLSVGVPKLEFLKNLSKSLVMLLFIVPLTKYYGINGVCYSLVIGALAAIPLWLRVMDVAKLRIRDLLGRLIIPMIQCGGVIFAVYIVQKLNFKSSVISLSVSVVACAFLYAISAFAIGKYCNRGIYCLAQRIKNNF